jgi:putative Holliday junction resolvase
MIYADFKDFIKNLPGVGPILGIDWGAKRTGIAITDNRREFVFPREIIMGALQSRIAEIIESEKAAAIVIGLPTHADGTDSETTQKVREFANALAAVTDIPITFVDERLSSIAAEEMGKGKHIDSQAAAVILSDAVSMMKRTMG